MTALWEPLVTELAAWRREGKRVPLWWRDDDATLPSPALDRLLSLTAERAIPVHLAVIPRDATLALSDRLRPVAAVHVLVHGWTHRNHEPPDRKKAEFGSGRPLALVLDEARSGLDRLTTLFGDQCAPILIPPWNRFSPDLPAELARLGYVALSAFGPEPKVHGLPRWNTHLDVIDWHGSRSLTPPDQLIAQVTALLKERRHPPSAPHQIPARPFRPLGLLTHHLDHDAAVWSFLETLLEQFTTSEAVRWVSAKETPWTC
ncbi:MAG: polysaccharide deacetylase family protein [Rhodospirillum sp.]|nr:polysaccharide deacetylase family protein [Rhodospirillum sp.]MCF8489563.1 polysaccharide deacetylase family protein [Rhodospirillum sp.]MCF8501595.1 polysaccharide deacetylase family protein [Rhodospirillum sp.]